MRLTLKTSNALHHGRYLARVALADGSEMYIEPKAGELDTHGQVIGGQSKVREIIDREFEAVRHRGGYTSFEFRDSSVSSAYENGEFSKSFSKYKTEPVQRGKPLRKSESPRENESYALKVFSLREQFELRYYEQEAQRIFSDIVAEHQLHHLKKWFDSVSARVEDRLKNKKGELTPDGQIVDKWLRLEEKLARANQTELIDRTEFKRDVVAHTEEPENGRELASNLGIVDDLELPLNVKNSAPNHLNDNLRYVLDLSTLRDIARREATRRSRMGSWEHNPFGYTEWVETNGVNALHDAAVKLHQTKGVDESAIEAYASASKALGGASHPMVQDYTRRLAVLGAEVPTHEDLAAWKARSHSAYREHANRLHLIEFAQNNRSTKKSIIDLRKSFSMCLAAYDDLATQLKTYA